jgi:hypothetical protein
LEQVFVRSGSCRILRLEMIAAFLGIALAVLPAAAQQVATHTALSLQTRSESGRTQVTAAITVTGADGVPAIGVVNLNDGARQLAQLVLNDEGKATSVVAITPGDHALRAVYLGDEAHQASASDATDATGQPSSTPSFTLSLAAVAPSTLPLTVSPGGSGTIAVTITPVDNTALATPMFVTLSCSGLPSLATCTFTPETIEILPTTPTSCSSGAPPASCPPISSMLIQTQAQVTSLAPGPAAPMHRKSPVAWAVLLPGVLGLGGLAWGTRRRAWLSRLALIALVSLVTILGTTSCKALYGFYENGPPHPIATPAGTFSVTVTGQSSNGVTAVANSTTMVLTVQ